MENEIKCYQFSNNLSLSSEFWKDIDYHWKVNQIKLPGILNWIRRLIKRGGYRYEDYYDKDAVNPMEEWFEKECKKALEIIQTWSIGGL